MTEPDEPKTLPKRTMVKQVLLTRETLLLSENSNRASLRLNACRVISARRLVLPITLIGHTALSVEISTKLATLHCSATCPVLSVPMTLLSCLQRCCARSSAHACRRPHGKRYLRSSFS